MSQTIDMNKKEWRAGFEPASPLEVLFSPLKLYFHSLLLSYWKKPKLSLKPDLSLIIAGLLFGDFLKKFDICFEIDGQIFVNVFFIIIYFKKTIIKSSKDLNLNVYTYHLATCGKYKSF